MGREQMSALERHSQTIIASLMLLILVWVGNTVAEGTIVAATTKKEITQLSSNLTELKTAIKELADKSDVDELKVRLSLLENDVKRIDKEQASRKLRIEFLEKNDEKTHQ